MKKMVLVFFFGYVSALAQQFQATKADTLHFDADVLLETDKFGYRYGIRNNVFFKAKGTEQAEYKNLSYGKIARVDLQNPLKIILFYEDFNTIVTLDNQLNETQRINFSDNPVPLVVAATGMASRNRFWIYDSLSMKIGLFDYLNSKYVPLTQPLQGNIKYYEADFNYFQWIDEKLNWYACDIFGKISALGSIPEFDQVKIVNPQLVLFSKNGVLYFKDYKTARILPDENVEKTFKSFTYKDQILSIFTTRGITNYKITLP